MTNKINGVVAANKGGKLPFVAKIVENRSNKTKLADIPIPNAK